MKGCQPFCVISVAAAAAAAKQAIFIAKAY
jgi:hypothetical protein